MKNLSYFVILVMETLALVEEKISAKVIEVNLHWLNTDKKSMQYNGVLENHLYSKNCYFF